MDILKKRSKIIKKKGQSGSRMQIKKTVPDRRKPYYLATLSSQLTIDIMASIEMAHAPTKIIHAPDMEMLV